MYLLLPDPNSEYRILKVSATTKFVQLIFAETLVIEPAATAYGRAQFIGVDRVVKLNGALYPLLTPRQIELI